MKYIYLDHNIYILALDNQNIKKILCQTKKKQLQCVYSPAHIEESYKVASNEQSLNKNKMKDLLNIIGEISSNNEVLPTQSGLVIKNEAPQECYKRVSNIDTRDRVCSDSQIRYDIDSKNYKKILDSDKHNSSISNIEPNNIWDHQVVKKYLDDLNNNIKMIIQNYNNSLDVQLLLRCGIDKRLSEDFYFRRGSYQSLKESHAELEYKIEILFRVLNYSGYYAEKTEKTSISGTHDVSHAIYATVSETLLSMDKRFARKCHAVYSFLGINTNVVFCIENEIEDFIGKL